MVWITGASSGIGEAVAVEMARRGARVVLSARREAELERVKARCDRPDTHLVFPVDVSDADVLAPRVDELRAQVGEIDVFVHSSGVSQRARAEETELAVDRRLMELNYFASVALTKALLPSMLARGRGHLVPISSVAGKLGTPYRTGYCASKHALHGFYDGLRAEVEDRGVKVTIVTPGYVKTAVSANALTGSGAPFGVTDRNIDNGISPERCARAIADGVARGHHEVLVGGPERLGVYIKRFFPGIAARIVRRINRPT